MPAMTGSFRTLWLLTPEDLASRLNLAAAARDLERTRLCRETIEKWLQDDHRPTPTLIGFGTVRMRVPLSVESQRKLRTIAASRDLQPTLLALSILADWCPLRSEILVAAIEAEAAPLKSATPSSLKSATPSPKR